MAINNFIPTVWSETLCKNLDKQYVAISNCNREFEGEIKEKGSKVKICGIGNINIKDYTRNIAMSDPQPVDDYATELCIDQAKYFNFQIDDIDKTQGSPKLMEEAMRCAAEALANESDKYIYSLYQDAGYSLRDISCDPEKVINLIIKARTKLYEQNVSAGTELVLEVSPKVAELIFKANINLLSDNMGALENGCIGKIAGFKLFVSNNIEKTEDPNMNLNYYCFARTKRAIAFAEQISEVVAYRPQNRFADAVKGLHLYGAKVVYPNEFIRLEISAGDNPVAPM